MLIGRAQVEMLLDTPNTRLELADQIPCPIVDVWYAMTARVIASPAIAAASRHARFEIGTGVAPSA